MAPRVAGLGQCSIDHIALVDRYPAANTKKEVLDWCIEGGGPVATALVTLSRLGVSTSFIGQASDDLAGAMIRERLFAEGVNIDHLVVRPGSTSQTAFITVERLSGTRTICWARPGGDPLNPAEIDADTIRQADFLLLDGLMIEASLHAAGIAREAKVPVMLDAGRLRDGMLDLIPLCDYVVGSEEFSLDLRGGDHRWALKTILEMGAKVATITLGAKGSYTQTRDTMFHQAAFEVEAVDTTGAGDVFHGAYIYGLLNNWDIARTVQFASAVAALKCTGLGGRKAIPALDKAMEFMESRR
ncbi:MAG: PfkB family carbohydrate kinase [Nitrospirota bacterium]|nr:PfkB family carbohydrate kinase [Nitrospirota bacterium]